MGFKVFGIGDQHVRRDYRDERLCAKVAGLFAGEILGLRADRVILVVFGADVVVYRVGFLEWTVRWVEGWIVVLTFCSKSMSSAIGLSALYLTLFQLNVRRYCSNGSDPGQLHARICCFYRGPYYR